MVLILISIVNFGCSSGGTSNPVAVVTGPVILSVSPATGGAGTVVTIQGSRFGLVQGNSIVSYAGVTVTPTSWSDNQITLVIPEGMASSGSFVVIVNNVYSTSNSNTTFTVSGPNISYLSPSTGVIGSDVTIYGQYFGLQQGSVTFNGTMATIKSWSTSSIVCTVPDVQIFQSGNVSVLVRPSVTLTSNSADFYLILPAITSLTPDTDNIGARVFIYGQGFGKTQGSVKMGSVDAQIISWSESAIEIRVPQVAAEGLYNLTVLIGNRSVYKAFTVAGPKATSYSPSPVGKDDALNIYGNHFGASSDQVTRTIYIKDYGYVTNFTYSDTNLLFTWPVSNSWTGTKDVEVTISIGGLQQTFTVTAE